MIDLSSPDTCTHLYLVWEHDHNIAFKCMLAQSRWLKRALRSHFIPSLRRVFSAALDWRPGVINRKLSEIQLTEKFITACAETFVSANHPRVHVAVMKLSRKRYDLLKYYVRPSLSGYDFVLLSDVKLSSLIHDDRARSFYREKARSFSRPSLATSQMSVVVCPVNWLYGCSLCGLAIIMSINPVTGNEIWCRTGLSGLFLRVWPCTLVMGFQWTLLSRLIQCKSNYFCRKKSRE